MGWPRWLFLVLAFGTVVQAQEPNPKQRAKHMLATRSASVWLQQQLEILGEEGQEVLEQDLQRAMEMELRRDAAAYQAPDAARVRMKEWLQAELKQRAEDLHAAAVDRARSQSPLVLSAADWNAAVPWPAEARKVWLEEGSEQFLQTRYPPARAAAVDRQVREQLSLHPPPAVETVEKWLQDLREASPDRTLSRERFFELEETYLQSRGLRKHGLLEEADQRLAEVAREDLQRLAEQVVSQQDALRKAAQDKEVRARGMAEALEEVLVERVQAANAGLPPRDPLRHSSELGLWSGIRQQVASVAGQVAKEEWQTALKQQPFLWPGPEDVQAVLAEGWERYRDPEESEQLLEARWWEEARNRWLQQRVAQAHGLTEGQQERFLEECRQRLADAEAAELQQRFRKRIQGVSASVRREFAEEQAAPLLEALRELDPLPAGQVEIWMEARDCRAFEDVRALRKEARDLWQGPLPPMLKEAETQVLEAVNRLMTEAAGIHARQQAVVEALEEDLGASLAADVQAGVPLSDIRKKWMEAFQSRWRPTPDGERYPELFAANERLLEKTLRQWYNRVEAEAPTPPAATGAAGDSEVEVDAEASPSDLTEDVVDPPESTEEEASAQPGSGGMEEIPEAKLEMAFALKAPIVLVVTDTEAAEVQLEVFYGELQQTRRVEVSAATTAEAVDRLVDGLDPGLWADALARVESPRGFLGLRRKPETVSVLVYVESERIPYRTMLMLRERLTEAVEAEAGRQGTRLPQMEWSAVPRPPRMR